MNTIIVKPEREVELRGVESIAEDESKKKLYPERTKEEVLSSIEKGAKSASAYLKGRTKLKEAKELLNEL